MLNVNVKFFSRTDPSTPARYFCSHKAGIHCVGLPMVAQLTEMAQKGKTHNLFLVNCRLRERAQSLYLRVLLFKKLLER